MTQKDAKTFDNSNKITKYQTGKGLIEFTDKLNLAKPDKASNIHVGKTKDGYLSVIGMLISDYSKGTGENTVSTNFNLSPAVVRYLRHAAAQFVSGIKSNSVIAEECNTISNRLAKMYNTFMDKNPNDKIMFAAANALSEISQKIQQIGTMSGEVDTREFSYQSNKIFETENGTKVTLLTISRNPIMKSQKGTEVSKLPWTISISNGTGEAGKTNVGGTYLKAGTYKEAARASIKLSDFDMFELFDTVKRYIEVWENTFAPNLLQTAQKNRIEKYREQKEQR